MYAHLEEAAHYGMQPSRFAVLSGRLMLTFDLTRRPALDFRVHGVVRPSPSPRPRQDLPIGQGGNC